MSCGRRIACQGGLPTARRAVSHVGVPRLFQRVEHRQHVQVQRPGKLILKGEGSPRKWRDIQINGCLEIVLAKVALLSIAVHAFPAACLLIFMLLPVKLTSLSLTFMQRNAGVGQDWYVLGDAELDYDRLNSGRNLFDAVLGQQSYQARLLDYGSVYASKSYLLGDGRRVWFGWVYETPVANPGQLVRDCFRLLSACLLDDCDSHAGIGC